MSYPRIIIDKTSSVPIAEQIAKSITANIAKGLLVPGEKLPAERDLAQDLEISRGTVKRAYEKLLRSNTIEMRQGSGSYVLSQAQREIPSKKEAAEIISSTLDQFLAMGFSKKEVLNLVNLHLSACQNIRKVSIIVVSNNYEILGTLEKQLSYLSSTSEFSFTLTYLTLDTIQKNPSPIEMLFNYDLIIATTIDYQSVLEIADCYRPKIVEATITPCTQTLMALSALPKTSRFSIVYRTPVFKKMVLDTLGRLGFSLENAFTYNELSYNPSSHSNNDIHVVINFNESPVYTNPEFTERNEDFRKAGGVILHFEYRIERDSLTYIEDRIQTLLAEDASHE